MPQPRENSSRGGRHDAKRKRAPHSRKPASRYTVGLPSKLAARVERYAETVDTSMSKAIATLVRLGLDTQADRKREFLGKLRENLGNDDVDAQDRLVDEFRDLILGR